MDCGLFSVDAKTRSGLSIDIAFRAYLGNPKVLTVFVHKLIAGQYQVQKFTGDDRIISATFPELRITVKQIVAASQIQKL